jgi:protein TonB
VQTPAAIIPVAPTAAPVVAPVAPTGPRPIQPVAPGARTYGPSVPRSSDSRRVGTAPNGQPLYAAAWYRRPRDEEMRGYLSTASAGYAMIACRTVADFRVEDCALEDEFPAGSQMGRAVMGMARQFRVRPPMLGGQYQVGEWVRIRIYYDIRTDRFDYGG